MFIHDVVGFAMYDSLNLAWAHLIVNVHIV